MGNNVRAKLRQVTFEKEFIRTPRGPLSRAVTDFRPAVLVTVSRQGTGPSPSDCASRRANGASIRVRALPRKNVESFLAFRASSFSSFNGSCASCNRQSSVS